MGDTAGLSGEVPPQAHGESGLLTEIQRLPTSGARAVLTFESRGELSLAVPQLAVDVDGQPAYMNGGDSDVDMLTYRWAGGRFETGPSLGVPGGEDAEFFTIDGTEFLATATVRTGHGPYDLNALSTVFSRSGGDWAPFQRFETFAAKQWHFFSIGQRRFLALAQGVTLDGPVARHPRTSRIYEWDGRAFKLFQVLDGGWGYNWASFRIGDDLFLAYADHTSPSLVMRWDGKSFVTLQSLAETGGRAFQFFEADGAAWLAFANLTGESICYRYEQAGFAPAQSLGGPGAREFCMIRTKGGLYLVQVNFIHGTPANPTTGLISCVYRWQDGRLSVAGAFPTSGGTDATSFRTEGGTFLVVANSLTRDVRFRQDTLVYRFNG